MKPLYITLLGAGAGLLVLGKLMMAKKAAAENLDIQITQVKADIAGLDLKIFAKVRANNPSAASLSFNQPYLKIKWNGTVIGNSQATSNQIEIPGNGSKDFDSDITIPATSLLTVLPGIITGGLEALKTGKIQVEAYTLAAGVEIKLDVFDYQFQQ